MKRLNSRFRYALSLIWLVGLCLNQPLCAVVPTGYYSKIDGKKERDLKASLKACINSGKKTLSYDDLFEYYEKTDVVPGTTNQVFDYYNTKVFHYTGKGSAPSGMNKEHCCPQSWWGKGGSCAAYSDLFNVMPSESNANNRKSNYALGVVKGNPGYENPRMKVGSSAGNGCPGTVFEPCDEFKGDFARIYLYVATCYDVANWQGNTCTFQKQAYPTIKSTAFVALLLKWHHEDPVSEWEIGRNERVYAQQNNRNPFIDYPQLADYIWGDSTSYTFDLASAKVNGYGSTPYGGDDDTPPVVPPTDDDDDDLPTVLPEDAPVIFAETFEGVKNGSNTSASGSGTPWSGNDNFTNLEAVYEAGGAIRLSSGKKDASLTTSKIDYAGGNLYVRLTGKNWDGEECKLSVSLTGAGSQVFSFSTSMKDNRFSTSGAVFKGVSPNPVMTIKASNGRCFLSDISLFDLSTTGIDQLENVAEELPAVDLLGRPCEVARGGMMIKSGKLIIVRK